MDGSRLTTTEVALNLAGISKSYGSVQALKPMSLEIKDGEMLALLGPSGCGKTTTLRLIAGFEAPDTGSILINGKDVTDLPPNKRALGMVFQNYSLFPHMTVGENVAFGLKVRGASKADRAARVRAMLEMVRLDKYADRQIHQLSGGQQQRIALARALATSPAILLLDEPLGALDKNLREGMQFELREIQRKLGITSILVTHDQEEALTMSDRIAVMSEGQVVQVGPPTDVYDRPRTRFVSEFLGTANIFTGTVAGAAEGGVTIALDMQPGAAGTIAAAGLTPGQRVTIALRPEKLRIGPPVATAIKAVVQDVVFRGTYFAYELIAPGQDRPIFLYSQTREPIPADGLVGLTWPPDSAVMLAGES
jgi:spermidine/putrescine ABC transporter ATP-binding subunit